MKKDDFFTEELYQLANEPQTADLPESLPNAIPQHFPVVVVVSYLGSTFPDSDRAFLQKILEAVKIDFGKQVAVINIAQQTHLATFRHWKSMYTPKYILSFGIEVKNWATNFPISLYNPLFFDNIHLLYAESLPMIAENQSKKMQLWQALKTIFA